MADVFDPPHHPCGRCIFYEKSLWHPVGLGSVSQLTGGFSRREIAQGEVLFEQGAPNRGVFCVSKGLFALRSHNADGSSTLMRLAYPGEIIGFRSFLGQGEHQTEARALMPSRVCTVARMSAERLIRHHPAILERLMVRAVAEIDRSHARIIAAATTSNKERLSKLLAWLMARHGAPEGEEMHMQLPMTRSDLADLIGVQRETMSRLVKRLEEDGVYRFSGREVWMQGVLEDYQGETEAEREEVRLLVQRLR
ncbi:CRP/FNR family transcriptional regulator [Rhodobacter sp. JA431]|uniref:Crp/Fnr family transcriptional regulator n=1 Tax=Rhodobacter sp. JA431 TaxID=570013 RepID=UPI000BC775F8|nr:Crp/Fnr family transcriptional regulator [Rhodobacter sp. JA431]SOC16060.1 CRP/FNR family transcriptional regulator [Rhodobacter sp. JA431]